jgi:hypothetical protein
MVPSLQKVNPRAAYKVYEPVLLSNAPGPSAGQFVLEWFRLTNAGKWLTQDRLH